MASSSSSTFSSKYDVFLSFRGEDTRESFTSHLFAALSLKRINTFIDEGIIKGERISADLLNAIIEGSKISVIILSKNYADSKWCLDELVKILDCKQKKNQIVIPIFYHIHPSDVRKQIGSFGEAFVQHEKEFKETRERVKKWKTVLTETSYLSGYESTKFRDEAKLVDVIVEDILNKLKYIIVPTDSNGLVGINRQIEEVKKLLSVGLSDVRIVGIWGMGGIGKTTIAEALFIQISKEFQGKSFTANVREELEKGVGLLELEAQVFSQLLEEKVEERGPNIPQHTKNRLREKKVFIVLDDVNKFKQLEKLVGEINQRDRFAPGSRIIITTRDKQVLDKYGVDHIYKVTGMNNHEALEHFCNFAFRQNHCPQEFTILSQRIVEYANGNPLALKVLGSFLYRKSKLSDWENALHNLRRISASDIYDVLKISYDELEWDVKNIFLDIACFFKGDDEDRVISVFDDHDLMHYGLDVLVEKSLITRLDNKLEMHDLLQEMGQKIVYEESPKEPEKRSRLWHHEDVCHVLKKNKGTNSIRSISLNLSGIGDVYLRLESNVFVNMDNLKYLKFYMSSFGSSLDYLRSSRSEEHPPQSLDYLPEELRYLHWDGCPLDTLPRNFTPKNLIGLHLSCGEIQKIEDFYEEKELPKLKFIELLGFNNLSSIHADPSKTPNLERIILAHCQRLSHVPLSIQNFNKLGLLRLIGCRSLSYFPPDIKFVHPIKIEISFCGLREFPPILGEVIELDLHCTDIEEVDSSISRLTSLEKLSIINCHRLKSISTNICKLKSLLWFELMVCSNLGRFPEILEQMESLLYLHLEGLQIKELPPSIKLLTGLGRLELREIGLLRKIEEVGFHRFILPPLSGLSNLRKLIVDDCGIVEIPQDIGSLPSLEFLYLRRNALERLPTSIKHLSRLRSLHLDDCNMLESLPELPRSLRSLYAYSCIRLKSLPELPECLESLDASLQKTLDQSSDAFCGKKIIYYFFDCRDLILNAKNILEDLKLRVQHMAIALLYEKEPNGFVISLDGCGGDIPEWFSNRCSGSSITIQLPPHCCNTHFIGFAICAVLETHFYLQFCGVKCSYRFEEETYISKTFDFDVTIVTNRMILLGFAPRSNGRLLDVDHHTTVSFDFSVYDDRFEKSQKVKVKCCGVCPLYAHPNESPPNTFTVNMEPPTEEEFRTLHNEFHDEAGMSGTITEIGSIDRSDQEQINAPQQESSFLSEIFRRLGLDCCCLRGVI